MPPGQVEGGERAPVVADEHYALESSESNRHG